MPPKSLHPDTEAAITRALAKLPPFVDRKAITEALRDLITATITEARAERDPDADR